MKVIIVGAGGRMGQTLVRQVTSTEGMEVTGGTEAPGSAFLGKDIHANAGLEPSGVKISEQLLDLIVDADAVIDFTVPKASIAHAELTAQARIVHVIGTTGFTAQDEEKLDAAARHATIVRAGNFSLGVNLLTALTRQVAKILDDEFDVEIVEMHHRHKVDAPSGTALMLGEAAAEGRGVKLTDVADRGRDGLPGARKRGDIGFAALRGGSVVGEHSVIFAAEKERITLSHSAEDRAIFARGAVHAAKWGVGKGPGQFSMQDVLADFF